jgi:hypothetical protein
LLFQRTTYQLPAANKQTKFVGSLQPAGGAVKFDLFLTKEAPRSVERYFGECEQRKLIFSAIMRNGANLCLAAMNVVCGPVDLKSPRNPLLPGLVFGDLVFPDVDDRNTGRPVRILIANNDNPPVLWELGGYDLSRLSMIGETNANGGGDG